MIKAMGIALTGLNAATKRLDASAANIANLQTVGSLEEGKQAPYTPREVRHSAIIGKNGESYGVSTQTVPTSRPFTPAYNPDSPFANEEGIIGVPNINLAEEIINMKLAEYTFKANASVIRTESEMADELFKTLDKKV